MLVANWLLGRRTICAFHPLLELASSLLSSTTFLKPFSGDTTLLFLFHIYLQRLFEILHEALPKMSLIVSDFSYLPGVKIPGERAPLVSTKVCSVCHMSL